MMYCITGAAGFLGKYFIKHLVRQSKVIGIYHNNEISDQSANENLTLHQLDILDVDKVRALFRKYRPHVLIHCAGITNVDYCESNPDLAMQVNGFAAGELSKVCSEYKTKIVYISTDHIFTGEKMFCTECEQPNPVNVYAQSKVLGEELVQKYADDYLIVRTNFFAKGTEKRVSITDWLWNSLGNNKAISAFRDTYFSPIETSSLVRIVVDLISSNTTGIYNVCGRERVSKYDFALKFCENFNFDKSLVNEGSIVDAMLIAKRPQDMSLSTNKVEKELNYAMPTLMEGFLLLKEQY